MDPTAVLAFASMERHLAEATRDLFAAFGIAIRLSDRSGELRVVFDETSVVATIGYVGDKVKGAVVLLASKPAIESWMRAVGDIGLRGEVCDTIGEFSNMLLGRLKSRLVPEGFPILLSLPTTASGSGLRVSRPLVPSSWLAFDGPGWELGVRIDATFEPGFALRVQEEQGVAAEAGEIMLF